MLRKALGQPTKPEKKRGQQPAFPPKKELGT
jgi:hypothetical protein